MALLSEEEKQQLKQIMADYPNNEDLDLTPAFSSVTASCTALSKIF